MDKYVAYYAANNEYETFESFSEAEEWLSNVYLDDGMGDGYSTETINGEDYIAEIKCRSKFIVEDDKEKDGYKWSEEGNGYFIDGDSNKEEWPHSNNFDQCGRIEMEEQTKP